MSQSPDPSNLRSDHILHALSEHRKLWIIPGLAALVASFLYVYFLREDTFTARQTLIVRDDLLGQSLKPGQFESLDLMKSAQETILEIARKPQVIRNAMRTIGPANPGWFGVSENWPSDKVIEDVQESISLSAPNGAEFGHTETVVLSTKSSSRERAAAFVLALLQEMDVKINQVRDLRLRSMKDELTIIRDSARESLAASADRLIAMEREIGPDLPALRALSDPQSGESSMSQLLLQIRSERRQFENELHSARNQRETLIAAKHDPNAILDTSDELFRFQPALNLLKQELIKAQSALAESVGRYEPAHPVVQKHQEQVRTMHRQIHNELDSAKRGLESQIVSLEQKVAKSRDQEAEIDIRFNKISSKRVDYLRLDEEVKKKTEVFNEAQGNLASIQRLGANEFDVRLMTPVDEPQVSTRADGLGKKTTIIASTLAGLLAGLGLVLLITPGPDQDLSPLGIPGKNLPPQPGTSTPSTPAPTITRPERWPAKPPHSNVPVAASQTETAAPATSAVKAPAAADESDTSASEPAPTSKLEKALAKHVAASKPTAPDTPSAAESRTADKKEDSKAPKAPLTPTLRNKIESDIVAEPDVAAKVVTKAFLDQAEAIEAEISRAVAESSGTAASSAASPAAQQAADVKKAPAPVEKSGSTAQPVKSTDALNPKTDSTSNAPLSKEADPPASARLQPDSSGVATVESILANLDKVSSLADGDAADAPQRPPTTPVTNQDPQKPSAQTKADSEAVPKPAAREPSETFSSNTIQIEPSSPVQSSADRELELRRRASQRPLDIVKSAKSEPSDPTATYVLLGPNDTGVKDSAEDSKADLEASAPESPRVNPFLNPGQISESAQQMLEKAKAEADRQGMVAPVAPVKTNSGTDNVDRLPASTLPIPDQIKQLTDSIASFAKPIERVKNEPKDTNF